MLPSTHDAPQKKARQNQRELSLNQSPRAKDFPFMKAIETRRRRRRT